MTHVVTGVQRVLFSLEQFRSTWRHQQYDVTPDDQGFAMIRDAGIETSELIVVENFFEELRAKVWSPFDRIGNEESARDTATEINERRKVMMSIFSMGQVVHHRKFDYRGVIIGVDECFLGTEAWYDEVARSRPPKDKPWYHILVHGATHRTYVAERHLEPDLTKKPVTHPEVCHFFDLFRDGIYSNSLWN